MKLTSWISALIALAFVVSDAHAGLSMGDRFLLKRVNGRIHGLVVDYTANHGCDNRIWSDALCQKRDVYVYLPPGFDPKKRYPLVFWFHAFRQDEKAFLEDIVEPIDQAMQCGQFPPFIVIAPDGTIKGRRTFMQAGSFFVNSKAGNFEDFIVCDLYRFMRENYPIRPEPQAHVLMGASMGGFSTFNLAFKHPDKFRVVVGIFPPVNLRWVDCHGRYRSNFDPCCWGWREELRKCEVVARFYGIPIRMCQLVRPIYGTGPDVIPQMSHENPIELLTRLNIKPGQFQLFIAYAGKDQFNIDAQVESFLHVAHERGIEVDVAYEPNGRHSLSTALKMMPQITDWLTPRLKPYSPR